MPITSLFKNKKLLPLGILALLALISTAYLLNPRRTTQLPTNTTAPKPVQATNPEVQNLSYSNIQFSPSLKLPEVPPSMPIYSSSRQSLGLDQLSGLFAARYSLKKHPLVSDYWVSSDNTQLLNLDRANNTLYYFVDYYTRSSAYDGRNNPTITQALPASTAALDIVPAFKDLTLEEAAISYFLTESGEPETSNARNANLIEIPYTQTINGYPARYSGNLSAPLRVSVSQNNVIVRITFTDTLLSTPVQKDTLFTLPSNQLLESLQAGNGIILNHEFSSLDRVVPATLSDITVTQASLEYRLNTTDGLLIPYYRLKGTISEDESVTIALPAVKLN